MAEQISLSQFKVYLGEFSDAIEVVGTQTKIVHEALGDIERDFNAVSQLWQSPAANTFDPLRTEFHKSADDLDDVLTGILHRMRITYQNYVDVERKAVQNLTAHPEENGGQQNQGHGGGPHTQHHPEKPVDHPAAALEKARAALRHGSSPLPRDPGQQTPALPAEPDLAPPRAGRA
ncbi:hypothetical protein ABZ814_23535 [Micromonospora musae]|uniref:WXG100 family type VII secretion target n=1 Tax=Micromonospora musae TaxID=1894970 RepID=UPI0033C2E08B